MKYGLPLPFSLFDAEGKLFMRQGQILEPIDLLLSRRRLRRGLYRAKDPNVRAASTPEASIPEPPPALETPATRRLDEAAIEEPASAPTVLIAPSPGKKLSLPSLREELAQGQDRCQSVIDDIANIADDLLHGKTASVDNGRKLVGSFTQMLRRDPNLPLLLFNIRSDNEGYLYHHGLNVSLLTMSIASALGYPQERVVNVALAAMLQDIGMMRVPEEIRSAQRKLSHDEWMEVERHPIYSVDALERARSMSTDALLVVYQSHERCDRSGYPRRRHQQFIHPLSRLVAVTDTYAAVTCSRPHRPGKSPYVGMTTLLREAAAGKLDKGVVRAFLAAMSLFPLGSFVKLSDGSVAKVLRAVGTDPKAPVVVPLNADGTETDVEVDLSKQKGLHILAALNADEITGQPSEPALPTTPALLKTG